VQRLSDNPDIIICMDWKRSSGRLIKKAKDRGIPAILVKSEPSVVILGHSNSAIDSMFDKVIEIGRPKAEPLIKYPISWSLDFFDNAKRLDRAVAVSAHKFSFVSGELYSLRSEAYSKLDYLDLFGVGWERSFLANLLKMARELQIALRGNVRLLSFGCFRNLRNKPLNFIGETENKLRSMSRYRVALVIENSAEYMSEKLVDSILAGTIPVYVGPSLQSFGIPKGLVVTAEPNLVSINQSLHRALNMPHGDWHELAKCWLRGKGTKEEWDSFHVNLMILGVANLEASA